jgi:hypothetical protein
VEQAEGRHPKEHSDQSEGHPGSRGEVVDREQSGAALGTLEITCRCGFGEVVAAVDHTDADRCHADRYTARDHVLVRRHSASLKISKLDLSLLVSHTFS